MERDPTTAQRLRDLLTKLLSLTKTGALHWERQVGSEHRYARWNNNLLILGPADPPEETNAPRYLFITPFDSPDCVEINSNDSEFGAGVMELITAVEGVTRNSPAVDPFSMNEEMLSRLTK
jgi:hypothetical protein